MKVEWWKISFTIEPDEISLEHIADLIKEGYTEGYLIVDGDDEEADEENV